MDTILPVTSKANHTELKPAERLNFVDRTISFFNPSYGVKAMVARENLHRFGYNDHVERRGRPPTIQQTASETYANNRDRVKMMSDARDLARYDWIGGVLGKVVLYVAGRCHCKTNTGDEQFDAIYDDDFHNWCGDERSEDGRSRCDFSGRHRLLKQIQMTLLAFMVDGDHGLIEVEAQSSPSALVDADGNWIPGTGEFCLQNIEADRIGSPLDATTNENYIGGVMLNPDNGQVDAYRVFHRTRAGQYTAPQDIPAASFIHVFDPDHSDEYRGRTKLLRLLNDARDIREILEGEKIAGKTQTQWAALIGSKDPFNGTGASAWNGKTDVGTPTQDAIWGKLLKLAEGESFSMLAPSARPSGAAMALWEMLIHKMAVCLGLSYGLLWDITTLGGANTRVALQSDLRQIQYWQDNILVSLILNRVRQKRLAEGMARGLLPVHPNWKKCTWNFGPHLTADLAYEMEADIAGLQHGIIPVEDVMAKHGYTAKDVFSLNASTANVALGVGAENQVPVESFAPGLYPNLTDQKAAFLTPAPIPPPPPGSIDAIGDKGVAKILELLEKVGEGTIDRESAVNTLVYVFGVSRQRAEKMIPDEPDEAQLNRAAGLDAKGRHAPVGPKIMVAGKTAPSKNGAKKTAGARR